MKKLILLVRKALGAPRLHRARRTSSAAKTSNVSKEGNSDAQREEIKALRKLTSTDPLAARRRIGELENTTVRSKLNLDCSKELYKRFLLAESLASADASLADHRTAEGLRHRAVLLEIFGKRDQAICSIRSAVALDDLSLAISVTLQRLNLLADLEAYLLNIWGAVEKFGWSQQATIAGASILSHHGKGDLALDLLQSYRSHADTDVGLQAVDYAEGEVWHALGKQDIAASKFEGCLGSAKLRGRSLVQLAKCAFASGDFDKADQLFSMLAEDDPAFARNFDGTRFSLRQATNRFGDAWSEYRHRPVSKAMSSRFLERYQQSIMDLRPEAKGLLIAEWGPGDEIRFASMYVQLSEHFRHLTITCEPRLHSLFQRSFPSVEFLPVQRWRPEFYGSNPHDRDQAGNLMLARIMDNRVLESTEDADFICAVGDVLADLRADAHSFPRTSGYLRPATRLVAEWQSRIEQLSPREGHPPRVALSWRSLLKSVRRNQHYLQVSDLAPLAEVNAEFWLFQTSIEPEELRIIRSLLPKVHTIDGLDLKDDFEGMSAFLANMDCVVAPCTTTAELAGALGVKTILFTRSEMLRWRRLPSGQDIWHPTVQIVHGVPLHDTVAAVHAIVGELSNLKRSTERPSLSGDGLSTG